MAWDSNFRVYLVVLGSMHSIRISIHSLLEQVRDMIMLYKTVFAKKQMLYIFNPKATSFTPNNYSTNCFIIKQRLLQDGTYFSLLDDFKLLKIYLTLRSVSESTNITFDSFAPKNINIMF